MVNVSQLQGGFLFKQPYKGGLLFKQHYRGAFYLSNITGGLFI
jgi:hypothetical protein